MKSGCRVDECRLGPTSHLTLFTYNQFGELSAQGDAIDLGVPDANGMALMQSPSALAD